MHHDRLLLDLLLRHDHLIDRDQIARVGLSPRQWQRRVENDLWVEMAPGVWRHAATPDTWHLRARAAVRWLGPDGALFGPTSSAWWDLEAPLDEQIHVVVPRARRHLSGPVVLHTGGWDPRHLRRHDGVRVQDPASSIVSSASVDPDVARLERRIDEAVRRRLLTPAVLAARLHQTGGSGHRGVRLLRSLLLDSGGESYLERRFLALVRREGLPRPTCQVIHRAGSSTIARVDFLFPGTDIVVEVTGRLGHASDTERRRDARRRNDLQRAGRIVLEFTTADVLDDRAYVATTLREWLRPPLDLG